jgi:hypothetical protein
VRLAETANAQAPPYFIRSLPFGIGTMKGIPPSGLGSRGLVVSVTFGSAEAQRSRVFNFPTVGKFSSCWSRVSGSRVPACRVVSS